MTRHHNPNAKQTDQGGTLSLMLDDVARYAAWTMSLPEVISSPSAAVCDLWKVLCVVNVIARFSHTITHTTRIEPGLCDCGACGTGNLEGITVSERAVEDLFYWFEWLSCLTFALIMTLEKLKLIFAVFFSNFLRFIIAAYFSKYDHSFWAGNMFNKWHKIKFALICLFSLVANRI